MNLGNCKVLYACSFGLDGDSGHRRATRQKLDALGRLVDLQVVSAVRKGKMGRLLELPLIEARTALKLLTWRPDFVVSRGHVGPAFQWLARRLGVATVREVHANADEEVSMIEGGIARRVGLRALSAVSASADRSAELRIFNNPALMRWFHQHHSFSAQDLVVYNGCSQNSASTATRAVARKRLGLAPGSIYLVFTGSASEWHGIEYLVSLQERFNAEGDGITIVCGGGKIAEKLDPDGLLLNIHPLGEAGCADLIRAGDLALLPVKNNRVSPGSPLKLYDYIANQGWIVTQEGLPGYSDEVERFGVGIATDFRDARRARNDVLALLDKSRKCAAYPVVDVSWDQRMREWCQAFAYIRPSVPRPETGDLNDLGQP